MNQETTKQENCCTPVGHIRRYKDCIGCDRKPKQETLEEAMNINGYHDECSDTLWREGVLFGAKWQAERMYSKDDMRECWKAAYEKSFNKWIKQKPKTTFKKWFNQFKKK